MELVRNTNAYESARVDEVPNPVAGGLALVEPISEDLQPDMAINYRDQTWEEALEARRLQDDTEKPPGRINRIRVGAAAIAIVGLAKLSKHKHNAVAQAEQLRQRAEDIWYRGNARLENLKFYMTDPEKGRRRQATTVGAIIGFSALVLANRYGAFDFGDDSVIHEIGSASDPSDPSIVGFETPAIETPAPIVADTIPADTTPNIISSSSGGGQVREQVQTLTTARLDRANSTIWDQVQSVLTRESGRQPSHEDVLQATRKVLTLNNLSWEDARHLPVGYKFKIPVDL